MAAHQGAAALAKWLHDMEAIFRLCHVGAHLQVMLASQRLIGEAHAWWLSIGDLEVPRDVWTNFKVLITLRYGLLPREGLHMHYRDPKIYHDMYMRNGLPPEIMQFTPPATIEMMEAIMGADVIATPFTDS
ncbi:hypothetical protein TIFTF001_038165 [Ficus carica]|uniref:Retrotransposon gag domain-containing protein n=1 Tax=Ficus carica TaxID=3494 RepID=A0AA88E6X7_FICCA|nr:hypothetical protein TIFTF001_038165 [Ficus carica]